MFYIYLMLGCRKFNYGVPAGRRGGGVTGTPHPPLLLLWFIKIRGALSCTLNLFKGCEKFLVQIMGTKKVKGCEIFLGKFKGCENIRRKIKGCENIRRKIKGCENIFRKFKGCKNIRRKNKGCEIFAIFQKRLQPGIRT